MRVELIRGGLKRVGLMRDGLMRVKLIRDGFRVGIRDGFMRIGLHICVVYF